MGRHRWALAAVLGVLLLGGCSGSGEMASSYSADADAVAPAVPGQVPGDVPGEDTGGSADVERQVVTTADTTVVLDDPSAGAQRVSELAEDVGGRVDQRSEQTLPEDAGGGSSADLVLRVPADEVTGLLDALAELGEVANTSITRDDVTSTAVDLDARISALQVSATRLEALMAGAATTADLLAAEQVLSDRQADLESLQAQRAALADQVELSTLAVHLVEPAAAPGGDGPDGFLGGVAAGWSALTAAAGGALVVLGVLLPWLLVAGVAAAVAVPVVRRVRRRLRTAPGAAQPQ